MNACLIYGDEDDPIRSLVPYVVAGLAAGERCIYVVGEHDSDHLLACLRDAGVDVEREQARGALVVVTRWEVSFPGGTFDPQAMIGYVRLAIRDALDAGFAGLRILAEMTWALQSGVGHARLIHYEALGCGLYPDEPLVAVCMYDRSRFPEGVCREALRTHPLVVVGERVCENVFYDLDEAMLDRPSAEARIDRMLAQLALAAEAHAQQPVRRAAWASAETGAVLTQPVNGRSGRSEARISSLTPRQSEIAALIADGLTNEQIAKRLTITPGTVGNHIEHILRRLELRSRTQVGVWAVQHGLYRPGDEEPEA